jgi:drug/metabolite transporter (DMT)-like permease
VAPAAEAVVVEGEPGLPGLIGLGLLAAALFSSTFVLNRAMSLAGGPWAWNAALRYIDMAVLMAGWIAVRGGLAALGRVWRLFRRRLGFWLVAGGIGFGVFYSGICLAADHAPGWLVAATWQLTILATPLVLRAFGQRVPARGVLFAVLIVLGIAVLNLRGLAAGMPLGQELAACLPVLVAAFAYPLGNQMLNRARFGRQDPEGVLRDPAASVLLMTLGAMPVFALVLLAVRPPAPSAGQLVSTALVALLAGCCATTLFLRARNATADPYRIAAVDATQAGEVGFALLGEVALLGATLPDAAGWAGLAAVTIGLVGFVLAAGRRRGG